MLVSRALPMLRSTRSFAVGLLALLTACDSSLTDPVASAPVATVQIVGSADALFSGQERTLGLRLRDVNGSELTGRSVVWSTSDASVATVSATGRVTAVSAGAVTVFARVEGKVGSLDLVVQPAPVASIELSETQFTLQRNDTRLVHVELRDAQGRPVVNVPLSWTSEDPSVATVTSSGHVRAVASGETRIVVGAGTKTALVSVRVPVSIAAVQVIPAEQPVTIGSSAQFRVEAFDDRGREIDVSQAVWSSSDPAVAIVSASGVVTGVGRGTAVIRAGVMSASGVVSVAVRSSNWHFESNLFYAPVVVKSDTITRTEHALVIQESRLVNAWFSYSTSTKAWTFSGEIVHSERSELQGNVIWRETGRQTVQDSGTGTEYDLLSGAILLRSAHTDAVQFRFLPTQDRATLEGTVRGFGAEASIPLTR